MSFAAFRAAYDQEFGVETGNPVSSPQPVPHTHTLSKMAAPMDSPQDGLVDKKKQEVSVLIRVPISDA